MEYNVGNIIYREWESWISRWIGIIRQSFNLRNYVSTETIICSDMSGLNEGKTCLFKKNTQFYILKKNIVYNIWKLYWEQLNKFLSFCKKLDDSQ